MSNALSAAVTALQPRTRRIVAGYLLAARDAPDLPLDQLAARLNVGRATLYRALGRADRALNAAAGTRLPRPRRRGRPRRQLEPAA